MKSNHNNSLTERLLSKSIANKNTNNNYHSLESNSHTHNQLSNNQMSDLQNNKEEDEFKSLNIHHSINNTENDGGIYGTHQYTDSQSPLIHKQSSEEQLITKQSTAISMSDGTQPTNTNVINALRHKASSHTTKARVDNVFLYSSIPKFGDLFLDHQTSAITLLHIGFAILTIILIIIGYVLNINVVWKYGTALCLITNIFGITHSMYSGSIASKMSRLDAALQNFALIIQKFAKALNIQEAYLCSVKNILDFLDHHILLIQYQHPEIDDIINNIKLKNDDNNINYKQLFIIYYQFVEKLKHQTITQHKKWLLTFFGQYKLLDNRFGITKNEYLDFIHKLPNKSRTFFQSLTGIHTRFKQLDISDELLKPIKKQQKQKQKREKEEEKKGNRKEEEEKHLYFDDGVAPIKLDKYNKQASPIGIGIGIGIGMDSAINEQLGDNTVLLYKDMTELVYKVLHDIDTVNKRIQTELAEKMISKEKMISTKPNTTTNIKAKAKAKAKDMIPHIPHGYILSQRMSVSLARDAPQVKTAATDDNISYYSAVIYDSDEENDNIYNVSPNNNNNRSNTLPITRIASLNKKKSTQSIKTNSDLRKIKSFDNNDIYSNVDFVKQHTLSMDDDWLRKVMSDLNDDDANYYDYSHSHSHKL